MQELGTGSRTPEWNPVFLFHWLFFPRTLRCLAQGTPAVWSCDWLWRAQRPDGSFKDLKLCWIFSRRKWEERPCINGDLRSPWLSRLTSAGQRQSGGSLAWFLPPSPLGSLQCVVSGRLQRPPTWIPCPPFCLPYLWQPTVALRRPEWHFWNINLDHIIFLLKILWWFPITSSTKCKPSMGQWQPFITCPAGRYSFIYWTHPDPQPPGSVRGPGEMHGARSAQSGKGCQTPWILYSGHREALPASWNTSSSPDSYYSHSPERLLQNPSNPAPPKPQPPIFCLVKPSYEEIQVFPSLCWQVFHDVWEVCSTFFTLIRAYPALLYNHLCERLCPWSHCDHLDKRDPTFSVLGAWHRVRNQMQGAELLNSTVGLASCLVNEALFCRTDCDCPPHSPRFPFSLPLHVWHLGLCSRTICGHLSFLILRRQSFHGRVALLCIVSAGS